MKRKFLHTDFIKFILEKYSQEGQEMPDDEVQSPIEDEEQQQIRKNKVKSIKEFEDEETDDEPAEDEVLIDELLNEYKRLKKKYENNKFRQRRK
jgi:hypothetical protein